MVVAALVSGLRIGSAPYVRREQVAAPDSGAKAGLPGPASAGARASVPPVGFPSPGEVTAPGPPPGSSTAPTALPDVPHPLTSAHRRLFHQNALREQLALALDRRDLPSGRRLLVEYEAASPSDPMKIAEGYRLLFDCLDQPSAEAVRRARAFYERETASPLRKSLRRQCLEGEAPAGGL